MNIKNYKKFYLNKIKSIKERTIFIFSELREYGFFYCLHMCLALLVTEIRYSKPKKRSAVYQDFSFSKDMINDTKIPSYYKKNYKFNYMDSFSLNVFIWEKFFNDYIKKSAPINYLEIGSFEGRSSVYVLENLNNAYCYFVDPFEEYEEMTKSTKQTKFNLIFTNFKSNVSYFNKRFEIHKKTSDEFFKTNNKSILFDLIYIDGSHIFKDVYKDAVNSDKFLNKDGYLIFDDFFWFWYKDLKSNPFFAINKFLYQNKKNYKIIYLGNQLILKKIA